MSSEPPAMRRPSLVALAPLAFLGGAAALLFETLWYRTAGLTFGNGVWATSLVLSAFMAGLALGSGLAARVTDAMRRPLRAYAVFEVLIGIGGVALVAGLPLATGSLSGLFAGLRDHPAFLNASRLLLAFVVLMIPATAMGATLPVLVHAAARRSGFSPALGRLYGWNTLGAVIGALLGEAWLIERFGIRGSAGVAASLNFLAAAGGLWLARGADAVAPSPAAPRPAVLDPPRAALARRLPCRGELPGPRGPLVPLPLDLRLRDGMGLRGDVVDGPCRDRTRRSGRGALVR